MDTEPTFPTEFGGQAFVSYAQALVPIIVGFLVASVLLSLALIISFIKWCGKPKQSKEFSKGNKAAVTILALVILAVAIVSGVVGWTYNAQSHDGVVGIVNTGDDVIGDVGNALTGISRTVDNIRTDLLVQVNRALDFAQNLDSLLIPLYNILRVIDYSIDEIDGLKNTTDAAIVNSTMIKADLTNLETKEREGKLIGVPSPNDVPSVDQSFTDKIGNATYDMYIVRDHAINMTNDVNESIVNIAESILQELRNETQDYSRKADDLLNDLGNAYSMIRDMHATYNSVSDMIVGYSNTRRSVVDAIFVMPVVLSVLTLLGFVFKIRVLLRLAAAACFILLFWYILIAGINYLVYVAMNGACEQKEVMISKLSENLSESVSVPGQNVTVNLRAAVMEVLECQGDTTLVGIFHLNFLIDDLKNEVQAQLTRMDDEKQRLNRTHEYIDSKHHLDSFRNTSMSLDYLQDKNITAIKEDLQTLEQQLNDLSRFGFSEQAYNQSLADVNQITNNLVLQNGTVLYYYYDETNITTLDVDTPPFTDTDPATQNDLRNKSNIAKAMTVHRNQVMTEISEIRGNITDIHERLDGFIVAYGGINQTQARLLGYVDDMSGYLDEGNRGSYLAISNVTDIVATTRDLIDRGVEELLSHTRCAFLGNAYSDISDHFCVTIKESLRVISAMLVLSSGSLFFTGMISTFILFRLNSSYYD